MYRHVKKIQQSIVQDLPFWDFIQRSLAVSYRRFGTTYRSHFQGSSSPRRKPGTLPPSLPPPSRSTNPTG